MGIDFVEERLELGYDYGCVGGPQFKTDIVENGAGVEQRNAQWWQPLGRWQLGERMLLDSDIEGIKEVDYLRAFFVGRKGGLEGFRFKDWADYKVTGQRLGFADGVTTQWQLKRTYSAGLEFFHRPITKPVQGTVKIYLNGNLVTYPLINYETGLVSFAVPPSPGSLITCDFEFDVPVCFEGDKIEWSLEAVRLETGETLHRLGSVFVKELRIDLPIEWYHREPIPQIIIEPLDLGVILEASETLSFETAEQGLSSGFIAKKSNLDNSKIQIGLPSVSFNREQLDKLLGYFWVARGRLIAFNLQLNNELRVVRFDSDSLSIKFEAKNEESSLFGVSNLVYLGILEEQIEVVEPIPDSILHLLGSDYLDYSNYQHPVNIIGNVPIDDGAYYFNGDPNNYISVPNHPAFNFIGKKIEISYDFRIENYNSSGLNMIFSLSDYTTPNSPNNNVLNLINSQQTIPRYHRRTAIFSSQSNQISNFNNLSNFPNSNFLNSFQKITYLSNESTNRIIIADYNGSPFSSTGYTSAITLISGTRNFVIGRDSGSTTGALKGWIKNFLVRIVP